MYLSVSSLEGGGCWLRAYDVQRRGLCIRASHQYCTEAMSKVGCNSSPILTWKIISNCEVLCYNECFSDHGNCLADFGRLEWGDNRQDPTVITAPAAPAAPRGRTAYGRTARLRPQLGKQLHCSRAGHPMKRPCTSAAVGAWPYQHARAHRAAPGGGRRRATF